MLGQLKGKASTVIQPEDTILEGGEQLACVRREYVDYERKADRGAYVVVPLQVKVTVLACQDREAFVGLQEAPQAFKAISCLQIEVD